MRHPLNVSTHDLIDSREVRALDTFAEELRENRERKRPKENTKRIKSTP